MQRVKLFIDEAKGLYGFKDEDGKVIVIPVFRSEKNARRYLKEMEWVLISDNLKRRQNDLVFTIKSKVEDFKASEGVAPNSILVSELYYNTLDVCELIQVGIFNGVEAESLMGMKLEVDRGNWNPRISVGILR